MIKKELIQIYRKNEFLLPDNNQDLWFSLEQPLKKSYYEKKFAILTAWNPNNRPTSDAENIEANNLLKEELNAYEVVDSMGRYENHQEASYLVYDIPLEKVLSLGTKYKQYSIFYNDTKQLSYFECSTKEILVRSSIS
jgi:hypothetical protein